MFQSQVLLPNMSGKIDYIGDAVKAVAYNSHNTSKRTNTISIHTSNFIGRIWIQGSLKSNPDRKNKLDWFNIPLTDETPYIEYDNFNPGQTVRQADIVNLKGSYVWLRAILDRSSYIHIEDTPCAPWDYVSSNIITSINVDSDTSISLDRQSFNYTPRKDYPKSSLNPQYDPEYYDMWKENFSKAYDRSMVSKDLGNIEKILICY
jgi:hypothetical protein